MHPDTLGRKRSYSARQQAAETKQKAHRWDKSLLPIRDDNYKPQSCRYISNEDPRNPDWCGEPVLKGYSYCKEHKEICYRVWDRKDLKKHTNYR